MYFEILKIYLNFLLTRKASFNFEIGFNGLSSSLNLKKFLNSEYEFLF